MRQQTVVMITQKSPPTHIHKQTRSHTFQFIVPKQFVQNPRLIVKKCITKLSPPHSQLEILGMCEKRGGSQGNYLMFFGGFFDVICYKDVFQTN